MGKVIKAEALARILYESEATIPDLNPGTFEEYKSEYLQAATNLLSKAEVICKHIGSFRKNPDTSPLGKSWPSICNDCDGRSRVEI